MGRRFAQVRSSDVVTWKQILASACARDGLLTRLADLERERASFERSARFRPMRRDYLDDVAVGAVPEWERALVHLVAIQDLVRLLAGRLRCGAPVFGRLIEEAEARGLLGTPSGAATVMPAFLRDDDEPERDEHAAYLEALAAEESGYQHDPGEANGGVSAHGANPTPDDPNRLTGPPSPRGLAAFATVEAIGAIPELAWHFCASAAELGMSSSFNAQLVEKLKMGAAVVASSGVAPDGPTLNQIESATRQRLIRQRLGALAVRHQVDLELSYTDRRYDNPALVVPYGPGIAPLVWRAAEQSGEVDIDRHGRPRVRLGKGTLRELVREARRDWPTYDPSESPVGGRRTLEQRIRHAAELILWTAHQRYIVVAGLEPPTRKRRRRKVRALVAAGVSGRKRRQLIEVPRRAGMEAA